jgi:hypothetical protein
VSCTWGKDGKDVRTDFFLSNREFGLVEQPSYQGFLACTVHTLQFD